MVAQPGSVDPGGIGLAGAEVAASQNQITVNSNYRSGCFVAELFPRLGTVGPGRQRRRPARGPALSVAIGGPGQHTRPGVRPGQMRCAANSSRMARMTSSGVP